jgi:hypothetical protein
MSGPILAAIWDLDGTLLYVRFSKFTLSNYEIEIQSAYTCK